LVPEEKARCLKAPGFSFVMGGKRPAGMPIFRGYWSPDFIFQAPFQTQPVPVGEGRPGDLRFRHARRFRLVKSK
jgi:hypothetical protein